MQPATLHLALGAALATLGGVMIAEGSGPANAGVAAACTAAPPADLRTQQQAGAAPAGGGPVQSGPDGRGAPAPSGTLPALPQSAATPNASLTLSGSDFSLAAPTPCPQASPAATSKVKSHKTRSNIQNN